MRRKSSDYKREIKDEPFILELEATTGRGATKKPLEVAFVKPSDAMSVDQQMQVANWKWGDEGMTPREMSYLHMLGGDHEAFDAFWAEWRHKLPAEFDELTDDIDKHFADGLDKGKGRSSTG